jgi:hypothetical protein
MGVPRIAASSSVRSKLRQAACGAVLQATVCQFVLCPLPVGAADMAVTCCADIELRIAELEAVAARSQSRKVDLTISGAVNRAILVWNDGARSDAVIVTNDNDNSVATIEGETKDLGYGWSAGFVLDFDLLDAGSSDVSQLDQQGQRAMELGELSVWIKNEQLGEVSIGKTSARGASSGANEQDLSGTEVAAYSGVTDVGGGLFLRRSDVHNARGGLNLKWDDVIDSLDEPDGNVITYSTPELAGFSLSALWGEDDVWNAGAGFHQTLGQMFKVAAALAVNENHQGEVEDLPDHRTVSGSISVLHMPTGLSFSAAGGHRDYIQSAVLLDGSSGIPESPHFYYSKVGWRGAVIQVGVTAAYLEYGRFTDFLGNNAGRDKLAGVGGLGAGSTCQALDAACLVASSEAQVWGIGVVQAIKETEAQIYLSYRHFEADISLSNATGANVLSVPLAGLDTIMAGVLIEF